MILKLVEIGFLELMEMELAKAKQQQRVKKKSYTLVSWACFITETSKILLVNPISIKITECSERE